MESLELTIQNGSQSKYPPMLVQYLEYKEQYQDCLLFFQVGDFFELFFDDAKTVAKVINLTLTSRDKNSPNPVPMCGVPISVIDNYAERLVDVGYSVAIVKQVELTNGKGMITRRLERIITPGIRVLGGADGKGANSVVGAISLVSPIDISLAYTDVQSGKIYIRQGLNLDNLNHEIGRLSLSEIIIPKQGFGKPIDMRTHWVRGIGKNILHGNIKFRSEAKQQRSTNASIHGYQHLTNSAKRASELLIQFVLETTVDLTFAFSSIEVKSLDDVVSIDSTTRTNLELVQNSRDGSERGTLFEYLKETVTPGGARLLREWIVQPLLSQSAIQQRLHSVKDLVSETHVRDSIREDLSRFPDIERIAARVELGIVTPRELGALRDSVSLYERIVSSLQDIRFQKLDEDTQKVLGEVTKELEKALVDAPPLSTNEGEIFKEGFDQELDQFLQASMKGKSWIEELEVRERNETGISSLKVKFNGVFGYFIEVTAAHLTKVPERYKRKQTTANGERYITEELKKIEDTVLGAAEKRIKKEKELFAELKQKLLASVKALRAYATYTSTLDVLTAFAVKAVNEGLVEPELLESGVLEIEQGKHPQLSALLRHKFIPNSVSFSDAGTRCLIITGPNMGGKSTYLRQTALIVILAQIGSFVPAKKATIGIVDKIFARLGASDNIVEGESTFMVEMRETSSIIFNATSRSLLLIDEIGRGTATADGLAIAQAILEWIVSIVKARTLFATHFHELTELTHLYHAVKNVSVGSVEQDGDVLFTHEIHEGAANRSYGIEVAKLAGIPNELLTRALELLANIHDEKAKKGSTAQLSLFTPPPPKAAAMEKQPADYQKLKSIRNLVEKVNVNETTPMEALQLLSELQTKLV